MKPVSLFIPAYNEEKSIEGSISKIMKYIKQLPWKFEVIIVDDSSNDKTPSLIESLKKKYKNLKSVRYENGPSRRENLAQSFKKCNGEIILYMDIDLATDINHIPELIENIEKGYDIAIGSRHLSIKPKRELSRKIISHMYNWFMGFYFKSKIFDHQCGFKSFRRDAILNLVEQIGYDETFLRGWFWDAELLIDAQNNNYKIKEFPVKWALGKKTSFSLKRELRMLRYIFKLR